jgi:serine protease AprX
MKKLLLASLIFFACSAFAQTPMKYWVQFSDKGHNTFSLSNPSAYLSARALQRRANMGIAIDSTDLPCTPLYVGGVAATGVTIHAQSKWLNGVVIITSDTLDLVAINALPYVVSTSFVGLRTASGNDDAVIENETFSPSTASTQRTGNVVSTMLNYGQAFDQANQIGAVCLHNAGFTGAGMVIAIIDAGFYDVNNNPMFDSLRTNGQILGTWDFVAGDTSVYEDNTHGAMVLSCIGGNLPGTHVGTAPGADFWLLRSEEAATEYIIEEYLWSCAAEYADSAGADLINSSLGYTEFDAPSQNHVFATDMDGDHNPCSRAADYAASRGMVVVVSAGNSGQNSWYYIGAPADADSVIAVGAVDVNGNIAGFSSHGYSADGDVKPDACARGSNASVVDPFGTVQFGSGTSFASPILCGGIACLMQANPTQTNMTIVNTVRQAGNRYANPDSSYGYGIPDLCAANLFLSGSTFVPGNDDTVLGVGQNPFSNSLSFTLYSAIEQEVTVRLYDAQGKLVTEEVMFAAGGALNYYTINELNAVADGVYVLQVTTTHEVMTRNVVKNGN